MSTGKYPSVNKSRIAVGGWSRGGMQAYTVWSASIHVGLLSEFLVLVSLTRVRENITNE